MANFPNSIFSPRALVDRVGAVYDSLKTKVFYAKDHNDFGAEIVAIETELGANPKGAFASVAAYLSALASAVGGIVTDFLGLSDTPSSYVGQGGKVVAVKADVSGLEFISPAGGAVDSVNGYTGAVSLDPDDLNDAATTNKFTTADEISKLGGIEAGAEVNNISDANATDLTDGGETTLHSHAAAGGGTPQIVVSTVFETANRFAGTVGYNGSGTVVFESAGMKLTTTATQNYACNRALLDDSILDVFSGNSLFASGFVRNNVGSDYVCWLGVGNICSGNAAPTFTGHHYGFKDIRVSSGTAVLSATNGNGTTETATNTGAGTTFNKQLVAIKTGTTDIKYYCGKVLKATHTTNLPTSNPYYFMEFSAYNSNVASSTEIIISSAMYSKDAI